MWICKFLENNMVWGVDSLTNKQRFTLLNIHADQLFVHTAKTRFISTIVINMTEENEAVSFIFCQSRRSSNEGFVVFTLKYFYKNKNIK